MGAYLSEPVTEKYSSDKESSSVSFGASSMQGWRVSQEDAHNCIIEYDKDCSLFAVYDGHGGAEVAQYCSQHLPDFIKSTKAYKEGNIAQALEDAFLEFDKTLINEETLLELKQMAGVEDEPVEEDESEVDHLYQEAHMPLEELLAKYRSALGNPQVRHLCNDKPQSPYLRGKKTEEGAGDSASVSSNAEAVDSKSVVTASGDCGESEAIATVGTTTKVTSDTITKTDVKHSTIKTDDIQTDCVGSSSSIRQSVSSTKLVKDDNEVVSSSENKTESLVNGDDRLAAVTCSSKTVASSSDDVSVTESKVCESSSDKVATKNGQVDTNSSISTTTSELPERVGKGKGRGKGKGKSLAPNSSIVILSDGKKVATSSTPKAPVRQGIHRQARPVSMEDASENSEESDTDEEYEGQVSEPDEEEEEEEAEGEDEDDDEEDDDEDDEDEEEENEDDDDDDETFTISDKEEPGFDSGCTAVVALLRGDELYVGNAGDSRCVVCRKGLAIDMSHDHKPEDEVEMKRIVNAGGKVTTDGRVNGGLNLSRAIGDHSYKKNTALTPKEQMISALPDIRTLTIDPDEDEFMVVACDGIWNFMSSQEVIDFVRERLNKKPEKLSSICEKLFDHCLSPTTIGDGTGCDNMTCVIVKFNSLSTKAGAKRRADDSVATTTSDLEATPIVSSSKRAKSDVSSSE